MRPTKRAKTARPGPTKGARRTDSSTFVLSHSASTEEVIPSIDRDATAISKSETGPASRPAFLNIPASGKVAQALQQWDTALQFAIENIVEWLVDVDTTRTTHEHSESDQTGPVDDGTSIHEETVAPEPLTQRPASRLTGRQRPIITHVPGDEIRKWPSYESIIQPQPINMTPPRSPLKHLQVATSAQPEHTQPSNQIEERPLTRQCPNATSGRPPMYGRLRAALDREAPAVLEAAAEATTSPLPVSLGQNQIFKDDSWSTELKSQMHFTLSAIRKRSSRFDAAVETYADEVVRAATTLLSYRHASEATLVEPDASRWLAGHVTAPHSLVEPTKVHAMKPNNENSSAGDTVEDLLHFISILEEHDAGEDDEDDDDVSSSLTHASTNVPLSPCPHQVRADLLADARAHTLTVAALRLRQAAAARIEEDLVPWAEVSREGAGVLVEAMREERWWTREMLE